MVGACVDEGQEAPEIKLKKKRTETEEKRNEEKDEKETPEEDTT